MRKLVACLACRNEGTRLYGKPLQNLDVKKKITIIKYIIDSLKKIKTIDEIVLAISKNKSDIIYKQIAKNNKIKYVIGDEENVLKRLILSCKLVKGTDIFRVTTESPFMIFEEVKKAWKIHVQDNNDLTAIDNVPDGAGFEIIKLSAYEKSEKLGKKRHKSELCSLFIRENKSKFKLNKLDVRSEYLRPDIRLTADYPEDLVLLRKIYNKFKSYYPRIPMRKIIKYINKNPTIIKDVNKYVEQGLKTMYI